MQQRTAKFVSRLAIALAVVAAAPVAHAGLFRTYLALSGNDANPCTLQQPCRLLPAALTAANDGGEVWMLDSANFNTGPVLIDKGIKILAIPGEVGSIVGNGGDALIINAPNKDVTLRNLVILNLNAGINGVNIQDAGAVHIEKTTVHDFADPTGACVRYTNPTGGTRIFIDDSFLRHCRASVQATALGVPTGNRSSVIIDNTRIERGFALSGQAVGILQQGCVDITFRNGVMAREDVGIQAEAMVPGCTGHLLIVNSHITRSTTGLQVTNGAANVGHNVVISGSQIGDGLDSIIAVNSGNNTSLDFDVTDSNISHCGANCVTATNTATDNVLGINMNFTRTTLTHATNVVISVNVPNGSRGRVWLRDSTIAHSSGRLLQTTGGNASTLTVSFIRSAMFAGTYLVDHGYGQVQLNGCHMTNFTNTFVNNGSADIVSLGNNWLTNFINTTPGFTYITPTIISPI